MFWEGKELAPMSTCPLLALSVVSLQCGIWSAIDVTADMARLAAGSPL
jgi:hypothetical protein